MEVDKKYNINSKTKANIKNKNDIYYMNIDVEENMCQGVYFKKNIACKCKNRAKYLKNNMFKLCENHKNQKFAF